MQMSALFGAKNIKFFKIYGVFAWTRGSIFRKFVQSSFMDGPLCITGRLHAFAMY